MMGFTIAILRFGNLRMNNKRVAPEDTIISYYQNRNCAKTGHVLRLGRKRAKSILRCLIKRKTLIKFFTGQYGHSKKACTTYEAYLPVAIPPS